MARLVGVCREGEEDYPFLARQIPLYIDDSLTVSRVSQIFYQMENGMGLLINQCLPSTGSLSRNKGVVITKGKTVIFHLSDS